MFKGWSVLYQALSGAGEAMMAVSSWRGGIVVDDFVFEAEVSDGGFFLSGSRIRLTVTITITNRDEMESRLGIDRRPRRYCGVGEELAIGVAVVVDAEVVEVQEGRRPTKKAAELWSSRSSRGPRRL